MSKTVEKEKRTVFVLIKDRSKYAKQKIFPEKNFVNRRALQFVPFMMVGTVKNRPLNADAISAGEKIYFSIFRKTKVVSNNFRLGPIHGNSLKEISFLDRNAPVRS